MRGGQWQVLRLLKGLTALGEQPTLMAREDSPLYAHAKRDGLRLCRLTTLGLPHLARQSELVHAHDGRAHALAVLFRRTPVVVSRRVAFPIHENVVSRRKYGRADGFIAVSRYVAAVLVGGGVPEEKITVVHDGVPLLPLSDRTGGMITPGSNDPQKGVRVVLEAARLLRVQVIPSSDLEEDLRTASLFVYVTYSEGLGSAALLAMSAGVPVVASAIGGLTEVVRDHQDGLLVPNDPVAIARTVKELAENPDLARQFRESARQRIETEFSEARMVEQTQNVYQKILASA